MILKNSGIAAPVARSREGWWLAPQGTAGRWQCQTLRPVLSPSPEDATVPSIPSDMLPTVISVHTISSLVRVFHQPSWNQGTLGFPATQG